MVKQLIAIVALSAVHFTAVVIAVEGRYEGSELLVLPLIQVIAWLGLTSSALTWSFAFLNSLLCGVLCYFGIVAIARNRSLAAANK